MLNKLMLMVGVLFMFAFGQLAMAQTTTSTTTPGVPSTGGGNTTNNILILLTSGAIALGGAGYLASKRAYK